MNFYFISVCFQLLPRAEANKVSDEILSFSNLMSCLLVFCIQWMSVVKFQVQNSLSVYYKRQLSTYLHLQYASEPFNTHLNLYIQNTNLNLSICISLQYLTFSIKSECFSTHLKIHVWIFQYTSEHFNTNLDH